MAAAKTVVTGADRRQVARGREASGAGATIPQMCKKLGCAEQTFYRWRRMYGSMKEGDHVDDSLDRRGGPVDIVSLAISVRPGRLAAATGH